MEEKKVESTQKKKDQLTIQEHQALKAKEAKRQFKTPKVIQWILSIPLILFFLLGLFYIPFMMFKGCMTEQTPEKKVESSRSN